MTIRSKVVAKYLKILPEMMRPPIQKIKICEKLLERHFNISDKNESLSDEEIIDYLSKRKHVAKRIATAIHAIELLKKNRLPDSALTHEEIFSHQNAQLIKLKRSALEAAEIIEKTTFPFQIAASINIITPNIAVKINDLIKSIEIHIKTIPKPPKRKKDVLPHRAEIIKELTLAWVEMTDSPPEKLKRKDQEPYGKFYNFMNDALTLFRNSIHTEEAIKESVRYYEQSLS